MGSRMKKTAKLRRRSSLREMSFEELLATVRELADARREYGGKSPKERRAAAG
jgi:hypothetical protein